MVSAAFADRPLKKLVLFDVDGTLTPARQVCPPLTPSCPIRHPYHSVSAVGFSRDGRHSPRIAQEGRDRRRWRVRFREGCRTTHRLRLQRCVVPLASPLPVAICASHELFILLSCIVTNEFDFTFAENGLTAYKLGNQLPSQSFIKFIGEDRYKTLANFILHYLADIDIPIKRYVLSRRRPSPPMPLG